MITEIYDANRVNTDRILIKGEQRIDQKRNMLDARKSNARDIHTNRDLQIEFQQNSSFSAPAHNNSDRSHLQREEMMRNEMSLQG